MSADPTGNELGLRARKECCEHNRPDGPEDGYSECCICAHRPCEAVTVERMSEHAFRWQWAHATWHSEDVQYVLDHGHRRPDPWHDVTCPADCRSAS